MIEARVRFVVAPFVVLPHPHPDHVLLMEAVRTAAHSLKAALVFSDDSVYGTVPNYPTHVMGRDYVPIHVLLSPKGFNRKIQMLRTTYISQWRAAFEKTLKLRQEGSAYVESFLVPVELKEFFTGRLR